MTSAAAESFTCYGIFGLTDSSKIYPTSELPKNFQLWRRFFYISFNISIYYFSCFVNSYNYIDQ